jgi:hypothetical protein
VFIGRNGFSRVDHDRCMESFRRKKPAPFDWQELMVLSKLTVEVRDADLVIAVKRGVMRCCNLRTACRK